MTGLLDLLSQTWRSLRANALRLLLTALGIFWGAAMLTYLTTTTRATEFAFRTQLEQTGPRTIWGFPGVVVEPLVGERGARPVALEPADVERLEALELVERASPEITLWNRIVRGGGHTRLLTVQGLDDDGFEIRSIEIAVGRRFTRPEVASHAAVAVLGADAARRLFGSAAAALGRRLRVDGLPLEVIGVAHRKGHPLMNMGESDDRLVIVPYTTVLRRFQGSDSVARFIAAPRTREESREAAAAIRALTALHHGFSPSSELAMTFASVYEVWTLLKMLFGSLQLFMAASGFVTLLVGAVGVMNIMLVVVGERVSEIGLRRALGARRRSIFALFLLEATVVSMLAGIIGTLAGYGLVALTGDGGPAGVWLFDVETALSMSAALVVVGVVSGVIPAVRASRVSPAEALRATPSAS